MYRLSKTWGYKWPHDWLKANEKSDQQIGKTLVLLHMTLVEYT